MPCCAGHHPLSRRRRTPVHLTLRNLRVIWRHRLRNRTAIVSAKSLTYVASVELYVAPHEANLGPGEWSRTTFSPL